MAVLAIGDAVAACSTLLGIESGLPFEDGGSLSEAGVPDEGGIGGGLQPDSGNACDAGRPDPYFCNGRCGKLTDRCGNEVNCGMACAGNLICNETKHLCECTAPDWCHGRCDKSIDYCGVQQTCICPNGSVCNHSTGFCGTCIPNPLACSGKNCGYQDNGCAKQSCGTCKAGDVCRRVPASDTSGTCCTPKTGAELCLGKCSGIVVDPCTDKPTDCATINQCAPTEMCGGNATCCLRDDQPCSPQGEACCSGKCAPSVDAGDGAVTPQVCVP
ncbi:hypothetical protein [Pendulispora albinea]|uniref:Tryptophan synthase alpha chain n=1 Tax=Pendulispora albinea TaxID=2741071 RepID=A0ABZ2LSM5_9BACT